MLSHDMRNPISAINKTLELLSTQRIGAINPKQEHVIRLASNTNDHLCSMVNSFLDIFREENTNFQLNKTEFNLNTVIADCIEEQSLLLADKNLKIRYTPSRDKINVNLDLIRIKRTITNLLSNAINYSVSGGLISVKTQRVLGKNKDLQLTLHDKHEKYDSRIEPNRKYLWVVVKDQGYGVPEEYQEAIFEKFFTIESKEGLGRRGIGLGLAFCKLVTEAHGGLIFARTPAVIPKHRKTPGCEFHLIVPAVQ